MAKIVKNNWAHFVIVLVIFSIATGWIFSGFPRIWQNPPFPPEVQEVQAATAGPNNPGTSAGAASGSCDDNSNWSGTGSPGGEATNDTTYTQITGNQLDNTNITDQLRIYNFNFNITNGSTINGITVEVLGWVSTAGDGANYHTVQLFTAPGTLVGNNKATGALPTSDPGSTYTSFGGTADNWGKSGGWSEAEIESSNFGVALCFTAVGTDVALNIDHVRVTVTYTPPVQDSDSAVEVHGGGAQSSFALNPLNDTEVAKFSVLKFQVRDTATTDALPTLIDRITIPITGTGGNASTDIAWAELWDDTGNAQVATAASITNSTITFGSTPDGGGTAALDTVANAGTIRYTVNVYMKSSALTATDGQTYIFGINDSTNVGEDTSFSSSQMRADAGAVTNVTGTITVASSKLTFTTQPPTLATADTDFAGTIGVSATDEHINIDKDFAENITLSAVLSSDNGIPGTGTLSSTDSGGLEKTPTNGTATWTDTKYTYAETIDIKATSTSYTEYSTAITITTISLVQQATNTHTYGSPAYSITATLSSATANNLLVAIIATDKSAGTYDTPAGFTPINDYIGPSVSGAMAYKIAVGGETAITWSYAASEESSIWVGEYSGLASSGVFDVAAEADSADVTVTSQTTGTTVATAQDNELAVAMFGIDSGTNATGRSWTNSFTEVSFLGTGSSTAGLGVATKILSSTGTQTTTASWLTTDQACGIIATFKTPLAAPTISSAANQSFTVGDSATAISTITITDKATAATITAADDIRIKIPSSFNMTWATSDTAANIGGTDWDHTGAASQGAEVSVSWEDSNKTVVVPVTADFQAGDDITVYGLSFANFTAASSADNLELETDNAGTTADTDDKTKTVNAASAVSWSAYNDLAGTSSGNVTNYSSVTGHTTAGFLVNYATAATLDAYLSVTGDTADYPSVGVISDSGTDGYNYFNGKLNCTGYISYAAGNTVFTFTGLNSSKKYKFVSFGNRNEPTYTGRTSKVIISDADVFTAASSTGVTISTTTTTDDSATYCTGYNTVNGYVAAWTDIEPGSDGDFVATVTTGTHQYSNVIMLQELTAAGGNATISSAANQSFTVGQSATAISTITITDNATTPTITATNDIRIKIPATFNMTWATSDTAANIGGTDWDHTGAATQDAEVTVAYEDSGKTVVVPVTISFEASDDITVYGLSFANFTAASSADNLELEVDNAGTTAAYDDKTKTITSLTISFQDGVYPTSGYSDTRDTVIKQQAATADYGIQAFIDIDGDDPSSTGYDNWGILKWDVSSISAGSTVQSAAITINITDLSPSAFPIYEMKKNWVEGNGAAGSGANWNTYNGTNTWETAGAQGTTDRGTTSFGANPTSVTGSQTITLNASGITEVQDWINNPSTNYGIIWGDLAFTDGLDFTSREGTTASQRPKLTITYIPGTAAISSAANQSFTIGDSATGISTITITDNATTATITAADDIRIKIPSSFNMTWATSDTAANIGGTDWDHTGAASQGAEVTVTYEDSDKTVVVPVTADFEAGDDITVYGLSFANFTAASSADNLELETDNNGTTADTDDKTITVVANETIVSKQNNAPSSVSKGSTVNSLGTFKFDGSGTISQIILTEYGTCDADADLANVKLFQDDGDGVWEAGQDTTQLGSTVTAFNASDNATFSDFSLSAGGTTYVHVILDVKSTATENQTIGIEIYQASRVTSTKTVTASSWPVQLGTSNITGPSYTILFHADNRPGNAADGMAQLTADFNQADNQMEDGWTLTAVQNAGDVDPVTSAGGSQNEDGAYNASELKTVYDLPHFFAVGNHEAETTQDMTDIRAKYSGYPAWNLQAGPTGTSETTYSYDVGEMHIAVINEYWDGASDDHSGIGYIHNNLFTWLKNDLRASTKPYKMVVGHEPGYPLDRHVGDALDADTNNRNKFFNLLRTERVIAYMTGHDHNYHSPEYDGVFEVDMGVTGCMLEGGGAGQNDNFATLGYAHYDPTDGFKIRMAREDPTLGWTSPWVASVTRSDLRTQVLANTAEGAGTYWNGVDTDKKTKYFIDYTAADQTNPDWSGNNSSKWWENAFDDATASWTAGEPSIGYDQTTPASWINTSISKLNGVYGVFQRIRFKAYDKSSYNAIRLGVDYDDAITVWLNGTEIYKSSESPTVAAGDIWDKTASAAHAAAGEGGLNPSFTWIDVSQYLNNLNEGDNVLAIGNWNQAATSDDLMAGVKLILEDSIFIMESGNNRLMKRNQGDLTYRAKIGSVGAGDDQFNTPYGITSDSDYLWIADYTNNRIVKRQKNDNLTYSSQFNQFGSDTVFSGPKDIAVDGSYIYVVDAGNHRLVRGNKTNLAFVDQFGVTGVASPDNSHFNDPNGVYVDDDYVYVSDKVNHRVVKLNKSNLSYVSQAGETGVSGTDNSHFNEPYGIAGDDTYLYLSEASGHRLNKRLKSDLSYVTKSGTFGTGDDQFSTPRHIDIDNTYIYVIDGGNSRVKKHYQSDLSYVSKIGTAGAGNDQFSTPRGITIDHSTAGVSITVNDGEIDYGVIELGGSKSTLDVSETQVATNSGIGALDFNIRGYNALAWTLDTTSSSNHYVHEFATDGGTVWTALTLNYQSLATNVAQDATVDFDLRLTIPTETSSTSQDVYVTVQAVPP